MRGISLVGTFSLVMLLAASAVAQTAPAGATPQPPPQQAPPPGYQGYPPPGAYPGYPPPGAYPPPAKPPPKELAYHEGMTIPQGYHLESTVRRGPVIAGAIVLGVPYVAGMATAAAANYANSSAWLAIPVAGPWLTLGIRNHTCPKNDAGCDAGEFLARFFLVLDAIMQTTGGALFIWGVADKKERLVRDDVVRIIGVAPTRIGSGYGVGLLGSF